DSRFLAQTPSNHTFPAGFPASVRLPPPRPTQGARVKPFSGLIRWTHCLRTKAKAILCRNLDPGRGTFGPGQEPVLEKPPPVPKGHMAVYVGQKDGDFQRILVPVVYFNHPLFGDLLKESEKEYGFNHSGGITIPCRISEFERVQTRIKAVQCNRKLLSWKRNRRSLIVS
ncbi:UNVERIFIED_CONTAM: Auxin-responsive protein SAUR36, partial [Sesamum radiatum]